MTVWKILVEEELTSEEKESASELKKGFVARLKLPINNNGRWQTCV